ncbi:MAG: hypothetical protein R3D25_11920 [Geminicoccaceae bacterium]
MSVYGTGAVAIWHDIAAEGRNEFYAWHGQEHMPERVGIKGFIRGRRWIAIEADREYFNLYETRDPEVVRGPDYKARLDAPTPWTLSTVKHFRAVARSLCRVEAHEGTVDGALVATLRLDLPDESAGGAWAARLPELMALPGIAAACLLVADREASGYVNAEQRERGGANEIPTHALIVEGWGDEAPFMATVRKAVGKEGALGFYRQQILVNKPT